MPKEVIHRSGNDSLADVMVRWTKAETADRDVRVDLFMISQRLEHPKGGFWFEPDDPEAIGLGAPDAETGRKPMVGPVSVDLSREQINRLIRTLRRARDQAYGSDA